MKSIFVNLKRFEVPKKLGGLCPVEDPLIWIESVMEETVKNKLGEIEDLQLVYLLPESLIPVSRRSLKRFSKSATRNIEIGCQGVHWEDISPRHNFGAFTTSLPATSARTIGATWAIIGHSEERKAKAQIIQAFDATAETDPDSYAKASLAIDTLIRAEVKCALQAKLNVLLCVGESSNERGDGPFVRQKPRIEAVLRTQLQGGLENISKHMGNRKIVIGYEPIWAIGPGKTPPGKGYISFVSAYIKRIVKEFSGFDPNVLYGGGLKEENAGMIANIDSVDGGLVALTRFTGDIGFSVEGLKGIIKEYLQ